MRCSEEKEQAAGNGMGVLLMAKLVMVMCPICREGHESTERYIEIAGKVCGRCCMRKMGIMT